MAPGRRRQMKRSWSFCIVAVPAKKTRSHHKRPLDDRPPCKWTLFVVSYVKRMCTICYAVTVSHKQYQNIFFKSVFFSCKVNSQAKNLSLLWTSTSGFNATKELKENFASNERYSLEKNMKKTCLLQSLSSLPFDACLELVDNSIIKFSFCRKLKSHFKIF
jgi:hypothetical protein